MPRQRQEKANEETREAIKATARELMAEKGTAGLSMRAIARILGITAPALYHYFPSLDELITALIVDAFTKHAAYIRTARDATATEGPSYSKQIYQASLAYRQWVLENPIDFQLVYGNPIPGYVAPSEVTTPAARQIGEIFMESLVAGVQSGEIDIPQSYREIPPTIRAHYCDVRHLPDEIAEPFHFMNHAWAMIHGIVALEVYNHAAPVSLSIRVRWQSVDEIYKLAAIGEWGTMPKTDNFRAQLRQFSGRFPVQRWVGRIDPPWFTETDASDSIAVGEDITQHQNPVTFSSEGDVTRAVAGCIDHSETGHLMLRSDAICCMIMPR